MIVTYQTIGAAILGWREVYGYLAKTRANSRRMCYQKHRWYHDDDNAYTLSIDQERLDNATDVREPLAHPIPPQDMSSLSSPPPPFTKSSNRLNSQMAHLGGAEGLCGTSQLTESM